MESELNEQNSNREEFDQFYTNPLTAKKITSIFCEELSKLGYRKLFFIEPAAGTGNFLEAIRELAQTNQVISKKTLAFDIEPKSEKENIIPADFLQLNLSKYLKARIKSHVVIGNPPFGKR